MSLSWDNLKTDHGRKAVNMLIHGQPKTGKTTFCASMPRPIFLCCEDGLGRSEATRNVMAFEINSLEDFYSAVDLLCQAPERYDSVVIDSTDHLEGFINLVVARQEGAKSVSKIGFNKGPNFVGDYYRENLIPRFRYLQRKLNKNIGHIAHSEASKESPPDAMATYTRWTPKLTKPLLELIKEDADIIAYATIPNLVAEVGQGMTAKSKIVGVGERRLHLQPGGGFLAGSRYPCPEYIDLSAGWEGLAQYLGEPPAAMQAQAAA